MADTIQPNIIKGLEQFRRYNAATDDDRFRRLLVVGLSGAGKTYSTVMTVHNPVVVNIDNGLAGVTRSDVIEIPIHDLDWCKKVLQQPTVAECVLYFFTTRAPKLLAENPGVNFTFVVDTLTTLSDLVTEMLEDRYGIKDAKKSKGDETNFNFWEDWARMFRKIFNAIRTLKADVIMIAHENEIRDAETGKLLQLKWTMPGKQFSSRIPQFFTDIVRQIHTVKVDAVTKALTSETWQWQIRATPDFPHAKTRKSGKDVYINADWKELTK